DGFSFLAPGGTVPPALRGTVTQVLGFDVGRSARGYTWPDRFVICQLLARFTWRDRLCFLTEDLCLRTWCERPLTELITAHGDGRLGLLVCARTKQTPIEAFC